MVPDHLATSAESSIPFGSSLVEQGHLSNTRTELPRKVLQTTKPDLRSVDPPHATLGVSFLRRLEDAEKIGIDELELGKEVLGDRHPDTLLSMRNLALIYLQQGRLQEAEKIDDIEGQRKVS